MEYNTFRPHNSLNYRSPADDVWIGAHVCIPGGITIGRGAVVAAGAVIVKDVEANTIVAGVPANTIRKRV